MVREATRTKDTALVPTTGGALVPIHPQDPRNLLVIEREVATPPTRAVAAVREAVEDALSARGHRQGPEAASVVDERGRTTVHIAGTSRDGVTRVRVAVDASQARAVRLLVLAAGLLSIAFLSAVAAFLSPWIWVAVAVDAAVTGGLVGVLRRNMIASARTVHAAASAALDRIEEGTALPASGDPTP